MKFNLNFNRTFKEEAPKLTSSTFCFVGTFRDAMLQFISLFLLLYVQFGSPIINESLENYELMYLVITIGIIIIRVLVGFLVSFLSYIMEKTNPKVGKFRFFIAFGAFTSVIFFFLLFFLPLKGWLFVSFFLIFAFLQDLLYQFNDLGFWGFLPTITKNDHRRNKVVSLLNLFIAIGTYLTAALSPLITTSNAATNLKILAVIIGSLYLISQLFLAFIMQEREENKEENKTIYKPLDSYKLLFKNKDVFISILAFSLFFTGQMILMGNSVNYFYYNYGYGSFGSIPLNNALLSGGALNSIFTIIYGISFIIAMSTYPFIVKKLGRKKLLISSISILTIGYLIFFFFGFNKGNEIILLITAFITFIFQGYIYQIYTINCTNEIDCYKAKYHENRSLNISGLKIFGIKVGNGIQAGLLYLFLFSSSLMGLNAEIAEIESKFNIGAITNQEKSDLIFNLINNYSNLDSSLIIYKIGFIIIPLILFIVGAIITLLFFEPLDENKYNEIINLKN